MRQPVFRRAGKGGEGRDAAKLRMLLHGNPGTGKTWTSLMLGSRLGSRVAVIDTENDASLKYADSFDFDTLSISGTFQPRQIIAAIQAAAERYDVIIIDSLSPFWSGPGGFVELADTEAQRLRGAGAGGLPAWEAAAQSWRAIEPLYNAVMDTIFDCPMHVLMTLRARAGFEKTEMSDHIQTRRVRRAPWSRDGLVYDVDIEGVMEADHTLIMQKSRCSALHDRSFARPGADVAEILRGWLRLPGAAPPKPLTDLERAKIAAREALRRGVARGRIAGLLRELGCALDNTGIGSVPPGAIGAVLWGLKEMEPEAEGR